MKYTYIYILIDPRTNQVRYVGKADDCDKRLDKHMYEGKNKNNHKANWIKGLIKENLKPILEMIDKVPYEEWQFWERHYISLYKSWGFKLTNNTMGGDGGTMSPEILKIISIKNTGKSSLLGTHRSDKTKELLRKSAKEQFKEGMPTETKLKISLNSSHKKEVIQFDLQGN